MALRLGLNAKLYYKIGGVGGGGAWLLANNVTDVKFNLTTETADVSTRNTGIFKAKVATLSEADVEFGSIWDTEDPFFAALFNAWLGRTVIGLRVMDGPYPGGGQGLQADYAVTDLSQDQSLTEAIKASVTCSVTYSATPPTWKQ